MKCKHCETQDPDLLMHQDEHNGWCCDCFDLSCGMSLVLLNRERAEKGRAPLVAMARKRKS